MIGDPPGYVKEGLFALLEASLVDDVESCETDRDHAGEMLIDARRPARK